MRTEIKILFENKLSDAVILKLSDMLADVIDGFVRPEEWILFIKEIDEDLVDL